MSRLGIEFREGIEISKRQNAAATFRLTSLLTLMILAFFCACTAHGAWRVSIESGQCAHVKRQGNRAVWRLLSACCVHRMCAQRALYYHEVLRTQL